MVTANDMRSTFEDIINTHGEPMVFYQHSSSFDDTYDEASLTLTGSVTGSAYWLPVSEARNGQDFKYIEQGVVKMDDIKVFFKSGISLGESDIVSIPSLSGSFSVIRKFDWVVDGQFVYHKAYFRRYPYV